MLSPSIAHAVPSVPVGMNDYGMLPSGAPMPLTKRENHGPRTNSSSNVARRAGRGLRHSGLRDSAQEAIASQRRTAQLAVCSLCCTAFNASPLPGCAPTRLDGTHHGDERARCAATPRSSLIGLPRRAGIPTSVPTAVLIGLPAFAGVCSGIRKIANSPSNADVWRNAFQSTFPEQVRSPRLTTARHTCTQLMSHCPTT